MVSAQLRFYPLDSKSLPLCPKHFHLSCVFLKRIGIYKLSYKEGRSRDQSGRILYGAPGIRNRWKLTRVDWQYKEKLTLNSYPEPLNYGSLNISLLGSELVSGCGWKKRELCS